MKNIGESFGFPILVTVFLPGLTLAIGMLLVLQAHPAILGSYQESFTTLFAELDEWQKTFAAIAIISLLGSIVAALNGWVEALFYDRIAPWRLGISKVEFDDQWYEYLYRLCRERNAYVSRIVVAFLFESRMAVALLLIAMTLLIANAPSWATFGCFISALIFGWLGAAHHETLGLFRKKMFPRWKLLWEAEQAVAEQQKSGAWIVDPQRNSLRSGTGG